ncbi:MAG: aminopeptidase P family protein [Phycisphaerales bacterium]|nr:aminopeptidase P family protein [Phycisphaerales bacterium]
MTTPAIPLSEYATRRRRLSTALKKAVGVVFAGDHDAHLDHDFRPHPHFEYLTGLVDEPGAVVVLDPGNPVAARRELLFLRPLNPEVEKWDGYRLEVGKTLRAGTGFQAVFRTTHLPRFLSEAARRTGAVACIHPLAQYDQAVSPDLEIFRRLAERTPDLTITDRTMTLAGHRSVKSRAEVAMIQHAVDITRVGFETIMQSLGPGQNEFDVQSTLEHAYRTNGSRGPAFGSIVGSGINSTVLHYRANAKTIEKGDLVCIDSGAAFGGYGADITRTLPASGRFSARQKEVYTVVLRAMEAAIKKVAPGQTIAEIDKAARAIITKAGFGDFFIHGIGHHLGLETHDVNPDTPLREGAVVTIEPGVYLPDEALGVRIEDDVVVTKTGCRNLSAKIPKSVAAIEKMMGGSGRKTRG